MRCEDMQWLVVSIPVWNASGSIVVHRMYVNNVFNLPQSTQLYISFFAFELFFAIAVIEWTQRYSSMAFNVIFSVYNVKLASIFICLLGQKFVSAHFFTLNQLGLHVIANLWNIKCAAQHAPGEKSVYNIINGSA